MSQTIGIITGGQLGRMMIESFLPFRNNEKILVLDGSADCPCGVVADEVVIGSSKHYDAVLAFGKRCDVIILEFEHVNIKALYELEAAGIKVFCQPRYLEVIQDKGKQKVFLQENNIPTANFFTVENRADFINKAKDLEFPVIQKTFLDGYDGGGVGKISSVLDLEESFDEPSIIEDCVNIQREFSLICGRDAFGKTFFYPLVEQFFHSTTHIIDIVISPAQISAEIQAQVEVIGSELLSKFEGVGMWAIELFEDEKGMILVNEIAPRAHNSGHQSIEGNLTSQFAQYMRICLGYPVGSTEIRGVSVAYNLLGSEGFTGKVNYKGLDDVLAIPGAYLHLYGKSSTNPYRKMGHVTVVGSDDSECLVKIEKIKSLIFAEI